MADMRHDDDPHAGMDGYGGYLDPGGPSTNLPAIPPRSGKGIKYTAEEVDRVLVTLAMSRTAQDTYDRLKQQGAMDHVPAVRTIAYWRKHYEPRFIELRQKYRYEIEQVIVAEQVELIRSANAAAQEAIDLERKRIADGSVKDAAASARNMQTVVGIAVTKILELEGRVTSQVVHLNGEQILRKLAQRGRVDERADAESTAEED